MRPGERPMCARRAGTGGGQGRGPGDGPGGGRPGRGTRAIQGTWSAVRRGCRMLRRVGSLPGSVPWGEGVYS
ncbi:MAG: hypothetical protein FJ109_08985 [Deltaproteobacteria bacterium]|nr:hypothetical protein [Deltaproteobacteria bacterium]